MIPSNDFTEDEDEDEDDDEDDDEFSDDDGYLVMKVMIVSLSRYEDP